MLGVCSNYNTNNSAPLLSSPDRAEALASVVNEEKVSSSVSFPYILESVPITQEVK